MDPTHHLPDHGPARLPESCCRRNSRSGPGPRSRPPSPQQDDGCLQPWQRQGPAAKASGARSLDGRERGAALGDWVSRIQGRFGPFPIRVEHPAGGPGKTEIRPPIPSDPRAVGVGDGSPERTRSHGPRPGPGTQCPKATPREPTNPTEGAGTGGCRLAWIWNPSRGRSSPGEAIFGAWGWPREDQPGVGYLQY